MATWLLIDGWRVIFLSLVCLVLKVEDQAGEAYVRSGEDEDCRYLSALIREILMV